MKTNIINGTILSGEKQIFGHQVEVEAGRILRIRPAQAPEPGASTIDARGLYVIPGLIDIHFHGSNGHDTMDATPGALHGMGRYLARHGVTSYLPTTLAASAAAIRAAIENVANTPQPSDGAHHLGVHLEGPYLSREYRGAQPPEHVRGAKPEEYGDWLASGQAKLITVAPEVEGVIELIDTGRQRGIEFALGHTAATYEQTRLAVEHGLHQVTHTFNGMAPLHHRTPGALGAALSDERLKCQVIADGIHVHPAIVRALVAAKGNAGTILITDAMRATGLPDGDYALGDGRVHVVEGVVRTDAGGLAGSTLTMDQALRNVMRFADLSLADALPMATSTPAAAMGWQHHKGIIEAEADADLVVVDDNCHVRLTMVGGRVVYDALH